MQAKSVLLLTHDDILWQHWRQIEAHGWLPARGHSLRDIGRWAMGQRQIVVLDAALPGLPDWSDAVWQALASNVRIIVGCTRLDDAQAVRILEMGGRGCFHAYVPATSLAHIVQTVALGEVWVGRSLLQRLLRQLDDSRVEAMNWAHGLTDRETEVARMAAGGLANQAIADALGITERTVRAHLSSSFEKLGVCDRLSLTLRVHGIEPSVSPA
ncbi:LuxR C-terminal-related transcriptional regulator [Castellaniella sp.]|uniref:helix-turn-helix transcriptional regulator n=1 Tax=Castellaniella sp. TaxID=1955812 RepID=UPI00355E4FA0